MPFSFSRKKTVTKKTANVVIKVESNLDFRPTGKFLKRLCKRLSFVVISLIAMLYSPHLLTSPPTDVHNHALILAHEKSPAVSGWAYVVGGNRCNTVHRATAVG